MEFIQSSSLNLIYPSSEFHSSSSFTIHYRYSHLYSLLLAQNTCQKTAQDAATAARTADTVPWLSANRCPPSGTLSTLPGQNLTWHEPDLIKALEMTMQEIKGEDYTVRYENGPEMATVTFQGSLSLTGSEDYAPIAQLLHEALASGPVSLLLNLQKLEFINSSGINVLSRFVLKARDHQNTRLIVRGTETVIWQTRSLKNLQRLMPALVLEWV